MSLPTTPAVPRRPLVLTKRATRAVAQGTASIVQAAVPAALPAAQDSRELLRGARELLIRHGGETYRLRHTRNDKLILTK
jgi:hemin uptake protein HemP